MAQMVYEKLDEYRDEIDLDSVLSLVKGFANHKMPLKEEQELYEPLMEIAERKAEQKALAARQRAEHFLQTLEQNPQVMPVVPGRVYVEILQEGNGDLVTADDAVVIQFKEYAPDGSILKDTSEEAYTIPLPQTIRGFQFGMNGAKVGEKRKIYLHPDFGFGKMGRKVPNKLLIYEVAIIGKKCLDPSQLVLRESLGESANFRGD